MKSLRFTIPRAEIVSRGIGSGKCGGKHRTNQALQSNETPPI
jgi:hypothetical protein